MADHHVLIVDDDDAVATTLGAILTQGGFAATTAPSAEAALALLEKRSFDLIMTDVRMPGMSGLELLKKLSSSVPEVPVVLITAHEDTRTAVEAMRAGARDFMLKPLRREEVLHVVTKELNLSRAERARPPPLPQEPDGLLGEGLAQVLETLRRAAGSALPVLLRGEPGTGKELAATALHKLSPRARKPMVRVNCAAIPDGLIESELFGSDKGAHATAFSDKPGRFELAEGGTLFLDEVGDLSPHGQAALLRVLEGGEFQRLGSGRTRKADVRIVSATNKRLEPPQFRADLYERLNGVTVRLPALREHRQDVEALALHFVLQHGGNIDAPGLAALAKHDWPGNVRELRNCVDRLAVFSDQLMNIGELDVRRELARNQATPAEAAQRPAMDAALLQDALARARGNRSQAARLLGISRRTLYNWLEAGGLA